MEQFGFFLQSPECEIDKRTETEEAKPVVIQRQSAVENILSCEIEQREYQGNLKEGSVLALKYVPEGKLKLGFLPLGTFREKSGNRLRPILI